MREFKLPTRDWGILRVLVVFSDGDVWTDHESLQALMEEAIPYLTHVSEEDFNHAKAGYSGALVRSLGPPPDVVLQRIKLEARSCHFSDGCHGVGPSCFAGSGGTPECFMAHGPDSGVRSQFHRILWGLMEGAYLIIVCRGVV